MYQKETKFCIRLMRLDDGDNIRNKLAEKANKIKLFLDDANAKLVKNQCVAK